MAFGLTLFILCIKSTSGYLNSKGFSAVTCFWWHKQFRENKLPKLSASNHNWWFSSLAGKTKCIDKNRYTIIWRATAPNWIGVGKFSCFKKRILFANDMMKFSSIAFFARCKAFPSKQPTETKSFLTDKYLNNNSSIHLKNLIRLCVS